MPGLQLTNSKHTPPPPPCTHTRSTHTCFATQGVRNALRVTLRAILLLLLLPLLLQERQRQKG